MTEAELQQRVAALEDVVREWLAASEAYLDRQNEDDAGDRLVAVIERAQELVQWSPKAWPDPTWSALR